MTDKKTDSQNTPVANTTNLVDKTMERINGVKPISQRSVMIEMILIGIVIFVCLILSLITLTLFVADIRSLSLELGFLFSPIRIFYLFFELLIVSFVFGIIAFVLYRTTDWLLSRNSTLLSILLILGLGVVGIGVGLLVDSNVADDSIETVEQTLPNRRDRQAKLLKELEAENQYIGRVVRIDTMGKKLYMKNRGGESEFNFRNELPPFVNPGKDIRIKYSKNGGAKFVEDIFPLPLRPRRIIIQSRIEPNLSKLTTKPQLVQSFDASNYYLT